MGRSLSLGVAALAVAVPAQAPHTVPVALAGVEGGSSTSVPFGFDRPARVLCLYDAHELPWTQPVMLASIDLRPDNSEPGVTTFPAKQFLKLHLSISTAARMAEDASATFDLNHGNDVVAVIHDLRIALPAQPPSTVAPRQTLVPLPFDQGMFFFHDLSPVRGPRTGRPGLAVDLFVELQPAGAYRLDSPFLCNSQITPFGRIDLPRCQSSAGEVTITSNDSIRAGDRVEYTVRGMPADAVFAVALGSLESGTWNGLQLPFDLGSLPNGATGCYINTDWLHVAAALADPGGTGRVSFPIPPGRRNVGLVLRAQAICRDIAANPMFHVTSRGVRSTVCGPLGVARVLSLGDWQAVQGSVSYGTSFVLELR